MSNDDERVALSDDFEELLKKAVGELGITAESISNLKSVSRIKYDGKSLWNANAGVILSGAVFLAVIMLPTVFYMTLVNKFAVTQKLLDTYLSAIHETNTVNEECLVFMTEEMQDPFRPPVDCNQCSEVTGVHRVRNLSKEAFMARYAFTMQPVVIEDGQNGWSAGDVFTFEFFRRLYLQDSMALKKVENDCQFFPYRTEFTSFGEMLNMSKERAQGMAEPWYVGWSNCDGKVANTLRKHYQFPYFLPPALDHSKTDWVFMGLPGYGAGMHIDAVDAMSWQAQVRGVKQWSLQTPPECAGTCVHSMEILVNPGDIIVLDTNKWYHSTLIMGNETSIVIGSEYY